MDWCVKAFCAKSGNLSSVSRMDTTKGEKPLPHAVL